MTFRPAKVEMDELRRNLRRLFGVKPRKPTAKERAAMKRASRDPEEQSKRFKIEDGRVRQVE